MNFIDRVKIKDSKERYIVYGVAGVGAALALWYAWEYGGSEKIHFARQSEVVYKSVSHRYEIYKKDHLERVVHVKQLAIKEEKDNVFSEETMHQIQELAFDVSQNECEKIIRDNRIARRKVVETDKTQYEQIVLDSIKKLHAAYSEAVHCIMKDIRQDEAKFGKSVSHWESSNPDVALKGRRLYRELKSRISSKNQTMDFNRDVAKKANLTLNEEFPKIMYKPISSEHFTAVKEAMLYDRVEAILKLEEEDIKKLSRLYSSVEIESLQRALDQKMEADEVNHKSS